MSRDTFNAVLASTPNGATAGRVTSRGTHWTPAEQPHENYLRWSTPPALMPWRRDLPNSPPNLIGKRLGRLAVVGLLNGTAAGRKTHYRWVVRCNCGTYEVRKTRFLVQLEREPFADDRGATPDRCHDCQQLQKIHWKYRKEGARPISDFFEPAGGA